MGEPDLCRAVKGNRTSEGKCGVDSSSPLFKHCTSVGGEMKGGKCIISEDRLRELTR